MAEAMGQGCDLYAVWGALPLHVRLCTGCLWAPSNTDGAHIKWWLWQQLLL